MSDANPFVGSWKLVSWEVTQPNGTIHYLFSKDVVGYLIYTADGHMSAEIMDPDRQQSDPSYMEFTGGQAAFGQERTKLTAGEWKVTDSHPLSPKGSTRGSLAGL